MKSIRASWNRSTMSVRGSKSACDQRLDAKEKQRERERTGTRELEQVLLLKLLEHAPLDLDKLVRQQQRQQRVRVRVDGNVESNELVEEDEGVSD